MEVGRKILNLRKDIGYQQSALAHLCDITPSALSRIESGRHLPKAPVALRLSRVLGVSCDYLLDSTLPYPAPHDHIRRRLVDGEPVDDDRDRTEVSLTSDEVRLIESFRNLRAEQRRVLNRALQSDSNSLRLAEVILGEKDDLDAIGAEELGELRDLARQKLRRR